MIKHSAKRLVSTLDLSRDAWAEVRRQGVGGSDIAGICGLSPWSSPADVYLSKVDGKSVEENERMYWGTILEEVVASEFSKRNPGMKVERVNAILQHPQDPIALANLDRMVVEGNGEAGVLEIKTASGFGGKKWEDGVPVHYQAQVSWYLYVTGLSYAWVAVLIDGHDYRQYRLERDEEAINALSGTAKQFWRDYVATKTMPAPVVPGDLPAVKAVFSPVEGDMEVERDLSLLLEALETAKAEAKTADERVDVLQAKVIHALDGHESAIGSGWKVTYKANRDSTGLDVKALEASEPELFGTLLSKYTKTTKGARPLKIKKEI